MQPSARTVFKVDSGSFSSAKPINASRYVDLHRRAMRVFYCRQPLHPVAGAGNKIRSGAPGASAVGRGSDSRDVVSPGLQYP